MFINKRKNDERDKASPGTDLDQAVSQPEPVMPEMLQPESEVPAAAAKPAVNNLKPSIISEGFEFIGEIRSNG